MLALPVPGATSYAEGQSLVHQIEGGTVGGESAPDASTPMRPTVWRCVFEQAFRPPTPSHASSAAHAATHALERIHPAVGAPFHELRSRHG
jgi:hypothetical protein